MVMELEKVYNKIVWACGTSFHLGLIMNPEKISVLVPDM